MTLLKGLLAFREKNRLDVDQALKLSIFKENRDDFKGILSEKDQNQIKPLKKLSFKITTKTKANENYLKVNPQAVKEQSTVSSNLLMSESSFINEDDKSKKDNRKNSIIIDHSFAYGTEDKIETKQRRKTDFAAVQSHFTMGKKKATKKSMFFIKSKLNI